MGTIFVLVHVLTPGDSTRSHGITGLGLPNEHQAITTSNDGRPSVRSNIYISTKF